ncbi:HEAT repeat domain-containing protein [Actinoplanes sp. NPDC000266]
MTEDMWLARALDGEAEWGEAVREVAEREAFGWAVARLADPDMLVRRFAAGVVEELSFDPKPSPAEAIAALTERLDAEGDGCALASVVIAYTQYHHPHARPELKKLAGHRDPRVRAAVADGVGEPETLLALAGDPDGDVRATALAWLFRLYDFAPAIAAAFAAHRDDDNLDARIPSLAGLARAGDDTALAELLELAGGRDDVPAYWRYDEVVLWRKHTGQSKVVPSAALASSRGGGSKRSP